MKITIITHVVALISGVGIGALACSKYFQNKYREIADDEIESVKAKLQNMSNSEMGVQRIYKTMDNRPDPANLVKKGYVVNAYDNGIKAVVGSNGKPGYIYEGDDQNDLSDENNEEETDSDDENVVEIDATEPKENPYFITEDEYYLDKSFDKEILVYFDEDEVVADSRDEMYDDVLHSLGDIADEFARTGEAYLYVRNEKLGIDFEIEWKEGSFQEHAYGYIPPSGRNTKKARERAKKE